MCNIGYTPVTKPLIFSNIPSIVLGSLGCWGLVLFGCVWFLLASFQISMIYCLANPFKEKASKTFK